MCFGHKVYKFESCPYFTYTTKSMLFLLIWYAKNVMLNNSYVVNLYGSQFTDNVLIIFYLISILFAILVIISKNPIISVLFLISLFLAVSFYLMFLGLNFLGISYLLVYIGAVSILFLFILMLIDVRVSELLDETYNNVLLSIIIAFSFNLTVSKIITQNIYSANESHTNKIFSLFNMNYILKENYNDNIILVSSESWENNIINTYYIVTLGNILYSNFCIWLILTSIILLLAMVGCIIITIKQE